MATETQTQKTEPSTNGRPKTAEILTAAEQTVSERFIGMVEKQFRAELSTDIQWTPLERQLAQHLFIKIDAQLRELDKKRGSGQAPIVWSNVNMTKLALDAVHRVALHLDALIPNHIHPIPYFNSALGKYDLDLRIGYVGMDFCRRQFAIDPPSEVIYELVYDTDVFKPLKRSATNPIDSYEFEITNPFNRGTVIGGFGYIAYADDPRKNRLILVTERDFRRAESGAKTQDFWADGKHRVEMLYKTVVHRTTAKLHLDPTKVNAHSLAHIEAEEASRIEEDMAGEVQANANREAITAEFKEVPAEREESAPAQVPIAAPTPETVTAPEEGPNF